jgi:O-antigen ligase
MLTWQKQLTTFAAFFMSLVLFFPRGALWTGFGLLLVGAAARYRGWLRSPLAPACLAFALWMSVSILWSNPKDPQFWVNWSQYSLVLTISIFSYALARAMPEALRKKVLICFLASSVAATALFLYQHALGLPNHPAFRHFILYDGNKAIIIQILASVGVAMLLAYSLQIETRSWPLTVLALACLFALLITGQSRTAMLLGLGASLIALAMAPIDSNIKLGCLGLIFSILAVAIVVSPNLMNRAQTAIEGVQSTDISDKTNSMAVRKIMNEHSIGMIQEHPILGSGLGSWTRQWEKNRAQYQQNASLTAHNEYLGIAAQVGLLGTALLTWIFWSIGKASLTLCAPMRSSGLILTLVWVVASGFNATLRDAAFSIPLLFLTGLVLSFSANTTEAHDPLSKTQH